MRYALVEDDFVTNVTEFDGSKPDGWNQNQTWLESDVAGIGWGFEDGIFTPPEIPYPEPLILPPHLNNGGLARFTGSAPSTILENIRMSGVTRVVKGRYRVTHTSAMPSDQYSVTPSVFDLSPRSIRVTARTASYVEVRVIDAAGVAQDATEITVKTERVITS